MVIIADDDDTAKGLNKIAARNTGTNVYNARFFMVPLPSGVRFYKQGNLN